MSKSYSVVIVNYNTCNILKECLDNLFKIDHSMSVVVVDNASPDNSVVMVKDNFPQVTLIENPVNKGLAYASNQGFRAANGDYIVYLGSDAFPNNETITGVINYIDADSTIGAATPKLVLRSRLLDMDAHRGFPTPWASFTHFSGLNKIFPNTNFFNSYFLGGEDITKPHKIDLCISHFLVVKKTVLEKLNGWDEDYFLYGEDVDLCYRMSELGYKLMYLPQFEAVHYKGSGIGVRSSSQDISTATKEIKKKYVIGNSTRSMVLFYKKHYYKKYPAFVNFLILSSIKMLSVIRNYTRR